MKVINRYDFIAVLSLTICLFLIFGVNLRLPIQDDGCYFVEKSLKLAAAGHSGIFAKLSSIYTLERSDDLPLWWIPDNVCLQRFRPLASLATLLGAHFFGLNPVFFHSFILFFHALCAILVYFIAKEIIPEFAIENGIRRQIRTHLRQKKVRTYSRVCSHFFLPNLHPSLSSRCFVSIAKSGIIAKRAIAMFCGLVFSLHPFNYIAAVFGYDITFAYFFVLVSLFLFLKHLESSKNIVYFFSLFCFVLALLCREEIIIFPFVIFLYRIMVVKQSLRRALRFQLPFFIVLAVYLLYYFPKFHLPSGYYYSPETKGFLVYILDNYISHFSRLFLLRPAEDFLKNLLERPGELRGSLMLFLCILSMLYLLLRRSGQQSRYGFFILWIFLGFTPTIWILKYPVHFYMSSIGFSLLLGFIVTDLLRRKKMIPLLFAVTLIGLPPGIYPLKIQERKKELYFSKDILTEFKAAYPSFPDNSKLYFVDVPPALCMLASRLRLEYNNPAFSIYVLTMKHPANREKSYFRQIDNRSFVVGMEGKGYFTDLWEKIHMWGRDTFSEGERIKMNDFYVTVSKVKDGVVREIAVELKKDMNSPDTFIFLYRDEKFIPVFRDSIKYDSKD